MKIFWETQCWAGASIVPTGITCLTWMPYEPPTQTFVTQHQVSFEGNLRSKTRGLLAVGTESGVLGITVTDADDSTTFEEQDLSCRYNYNLRGHHSRIQRCSWNASMAKLASCDENGIIYVWVPNDQRWSVELVNDRGLKVRDFNWSHDGSAALILYEDNFVLIGSANGQRIWSNTFLQQVNCGAWAPNSKALVLGLDNGQIQVFNDQGAIITERQLLQVPIQRVAFSPLESDWMLAIVSSRDQILFLNSSYEVDRTWQSSDPIRMIQWSSDGKMVAVVCKTGNIIILNNEGRLIHRFIPPLIINEESVISFTWAHHDNVVIVASSGGLAVGRVQPNVPSLNDLISYQTWLSLGRTARDVHKLRLPERSSNQIRKFDRHIIRCRIPSYERMCRFVSEPTFWRWFCTIIPVPRKNFHYMLCIEHLGGLVPILLGRQINRVIPQFIISLPPSTAFSTPGYSRGRLATSAGEHQVGQRWDFASNGNQNLPVRNSAFTSDLEPIPPPSIEDPTEVGYNSSVATEFTSFEEEMALSQSLTNARNNTVWRRSKRRIKKFVSKRLSPRSPKASRMLCHVRSNVWCTRFKITSPGIKDLPTTLAQVVYKTSVLHLQPRQMTISLCDLRPLTKTLPIHPDFSLNHNSSLLPLPSALHRRHRSADSSPTEVRRNAEGIEEIEEDENELLVNNNEQVGQAIISPAAPIHFINDPLQQQPRYMTYDETRARLRERRPIQRIPVGQVNAANQNTRRNRRPGLRFMRRAAEDQPIGETQQLAGEPQQTNARRHAPNPPSIQEPVIEQNRPRQRHVRFHSNNEEELADLNEDNNEIAPSTELMEEEKELYRIVRVEFEGLCLAVGEQVVKMRSAADDLQQHTSTSVSSASVSVASSSNSNYSQSSQIPHSQKTHRRRAQFAANRSATTTDFTTTLKQNSLWQHRVESLDFIDDDAPAIMVSQPDKKFSPVSFITNDKQPLIPPSTKSENEEPQPKKWFDSKLADKLAELTETLHLTIRNKQKKGEDQVLLLDNEVIEDETESHQKEIQIPTSIEAMRQQFRDIARKTAQIEETLNANDIYGDLKQRIQRIKAILGETHHAADLIEPSRFTRCIPTQSKPAKASHQPQVAIFDEFGDEVGESQSERGPSPTSGQSSPYDTIRMSNKTPFWNDESQVYQLDFGGRVTQESAKNFQIEHDSDQVMQFGRIENGAYTLDFCSPLSAAQAFGIALASITQRLK